MSKMFKVLGAGCAIAAIVTAMPALAQDVQENTGSQLEDIVVTAQKRAENLQDVPISVSAVTASSIAAKGINTLENLSTAMPGITLTRQSSATLIYIRGIGTTGGQAGQEGAVATFVDGVYQPSMSGSTFSLNNIERIEVLKGPQGTLYGRNATGGAVNVITRDPSYTPKAEAGIAVGERDLIESSAYLSSGITDNIAADLSFFYSNTDKGFGRNLTTGKRVNTRQNVAVRGKLLIEPSDDTKIVLSADYFRDSGSYGVSLRPTQGTTRLLLGPAPDLGGFYNIESDFNPSLVTENWGGAATVEHDFGSVRLKSITAYRDVYQNQNLDLDFGPLPLFEADLFEYNWQFTQELQLASAADSNVQWIVGLFYLNGMNKYNPFDLFGDGLAAEGIWGQYNQARQRTKSYAAFGQATIPLGEQTNLTVGARYTIDKRTLKGFAGATLLDQTTVVPLVPVDESETWKKPTWRIALDHKITPEVMVYGSYSRGFKSGVYNLTAPTDPAVDPETLDAFELGFKSDLFDRRLRINAAGFYYSYDDIQLTIIQGAAQTLLNAAKAEVYGLDLDAQVAVSSALTLTGGLQVIKSKYKDFPGAPITANNPNFPYGVIITSGDASGNKLIKTPDFSATFSADYRTPLAGGELGVNVAYSYNDGFYFEPDEVLRQKAYHLVNGQIRWSAPEDQYAVRVFARNLFNTHYWAQKTSSFTGYLGNPAFGRQIGVGLDFKF